MYQVGDSFDKDCTRCTCRIGGQLDCVLQECTIDGPTCRADGDPHYTTFNNTNYDYQGICQYVHVERCINSEFSIKTRNFDRHHNSFSWVDEVTIEVSGVNIVLELGIPIPVFINGDPATETDGILYDSNRVEVKRLGTYEIIVFLKAIGIRVSWDGRRTINVEISTSLINQLCGLCGNYHNETDSDLQMRNGILVTPEQALDFGDSWLVPDSCTNTRKRDAPGIQGCSTDPDVIQEGQTSCATLMGEVFSACNSVLSPTQFIKNCEFDYCCCNDTEREDCFCDSLSAYAKACADVGVTMSTWRNFYCRELYIYMYMCV